MIVGRRRGTKSRLPLQMGMWMVSLHVRRRRRMVSLHVRRRMMVVSLHVGRRSLHGMGMGIWMGRRSIRVAVDVMRGRSSISDHGRRPIHWMLRSTVRMHGNPPAHPHHHHPWRRRRKSPHPSWDAQQLCSLGRTPSLSASSSSSSSSSSLFRLGCGLLGSLGCDLLVCDLCVPLLVGEEMRVVSCVLFGDAGHPIELLGLCGV